MKNQENCRQQAGIGTLESNDTIPSTTHHPHTVLLVDDEQLLLTALRRSISRFVPNVIISRTFDDAKEQITNVLEPGDLIISDLHLHEKPEEYSALANDGLALAAITLEIRRAKALRFILMSGGVVATAEEEPVFRAVKNGLINGFLPKPFSMKDLLQTSGINSHNSR